MKVYQTNEIKNIALIGGAKSGKTTLAEAMLFEGGVINRRGSVDDKNSVSDYREIELERQASVFSTVMYAEYAGKKINIIDTPGFDDFIGEVIAALKVSDTAVMVVNSQNGVEVGTEITWRYINKLEKPAIFLVNQLEHEKTNFDETIRQLRSHFGDKVLVAQYPLNAGHGFDSVVDVLKMKLYKFPDGGGQPVISELPAEEQSKAEAYHNAIIEAAAESEEALMEAFFENGTLSEEQLAKGINQGIATRTMFPVFCISGKHNQGVSRFMEFAVENLPAPNEVALTKTTEDQDLNYDAAAAPVAFVFKTAVEPHLGEISFFKVFNGTISESIDLINANTGAKERLSQLFAVAGKNRQKVEKVMPGDIAATIKLKDTHTNNTLTTSKNQGEIVSPIVFPEARIRMAVKAKNSADEEKLAGILKEMYNIDPTLTYEHSKELKQLILSGQGEMHLNVAKWMIENLSKVGIDFLAPRIPYRETITKNAKASYRHKKQSGGAGQFGEVHMMIEPFYEGKPDQTEFPIRGRDEHQLSWGGRLIFNNCIVGGSIDARFMPAILKGIMEKMEEGPLTGSYARDIIVNIYDGKMHPVDSNEISFKLAGRNAFKDAFKNAAPKILEPIYDVEVMVPEEKMGDVMTDLQGRRAIIMGMESEGHYQKIKAKVPLAELNRYSTSLSSLTSGRATYGMKFAEYQQVPMDVQDTLLKAYEEEEKDED
ncbi:MAG: elongation factor G [Bacteroidales bacterium]|jgi:elongation factor G|nr:elongation factor G [Bacteroidales bacterium]NLM93743.1 elongation factor G [Bacteroidales bacterium]